jgi:hypothetical protein
VRCAFGAAAPALVVLSSASLAGVSSLVEVALMPISGSLCG